MAHFQPTGHLVQGKRRSNIHRAVTGTAIAVALSLACLGYGAANASAALVIEGFEGGPMTNSATPTLSGSTEDLVDSIRVDVYRGELAAGHPILTFVVLPSLSGSWSVTVGAPLQDGTYTALAEQSAPDGQSAGSSSPYTFAVDTLPPVVTLTKPPARSNDATPSFAGSASDTTTVTIEVYAGKHTSGTAVATLEAEGTGGAWASASVSPPLEDGIYTAVAMQSSSLGNGVGESAPATFEVDTGPPTVTMDAPASRSSDTAPSFSGSASESTPVTVEIFEGTRAEGTIVATASAPGTRGAWSTGTLARPLPRGRHTFTAIAIQPSELGNPAGRSSPVTFVVDTEPPTITLSAPASPSNDTEPSFSGTTSEATPVTIEVYEGDQPEGKLVASAVAPAEGAGEFESHAAAPPLGNGTFTAVASASSAIGNGVGHSKPVTFSVNTASPTVTLNTLLSPSADKVPAFSGSATDHTPVIVRVYRAGAPSGTPVVSAEAEVANGEWRTGKLSPALAWGEYTAVATQTSSIGNPPGTSAAVAFAVEPIGPTVATEAASSVARTSTALYASVDPRGAGVSACSFEYGTSIAYGESIECGFVSGIGGFPPAATAAVPVFVRIFGLTPSTTYHYRIVAVGEGGTSYGADATFTTLPPFVFPEEGAPRVAPASSHRSSATRGIAADRLLALIAKQLRARHQIASTSSLLRNGGYRTPFDAPEPGTAEIVWSYVTARGRGGRGARSGAVLVARGALVLRRAGVAALPIRLTRSGRALLRGAARIELTETCVFKPLGAAAVRASVSLQLRR